VTFVQLHCIKYCYTSFCQSLLGLSSVFYLQGDPRIWICSGCVLADHQHYLDVFLAATVLSGFAYSLWQPKNLSALSRLADGLNDRILTTSFPLNRNT
jgi:hypothetical protein